MTDATRPGFRASWFPLPHGCSGSVNDQRRKHGRRRPPRFLVLAPPRRSGDFRATLCSGDYVDGRCVLDHGVIDDQLRDALERECAAFVARP